MAISVSKDIQERAGSDVIQVVDSKSGQIDNRLRARNGRYEQHKPTLLDVGLRNGPGRM